MCLLHGEESHGPGHLEASRKGQADGRGSSWRKPAEFLWVTGRGRPKANPAFEDGEVWDAAGRLNRMRLVSPSVGHPGRPAAAPRLRTEGRCHPRTPGTLGSFWVGVGGRTGDLHGSSKVLSAGGRPWVPKPQGPGSPVFPGKTHKCLSVSSAALPTAAGLG